MEHVTLLNSILAVKGLILYRDHSPLSYGTLSFAEKVVVSGVETAAPFLSVLSLSTKFVQRNSGIGVFDQNVSHQAARYRLFLVCTSFKTTAFDFQLSSISRQTVERT